MTAVDPAAAPAPDPQAEADAGEERRRRSGRSAWRRFLRSPTGVLGAVLVSIFVVSAVCAPLLTAYGPGEIDYTAIMAPPGTPEHWLGTDNLGRDMWSRTVYGARTSLSASVLSTLLALLIAVPLGMVAGYYRGVWDSAIMRVIDTLLAFPFLILAIGLAAILGPSAFNAIIALTVGQVPQLVRVTRGEVLAVREEDYVAGAIANGATDAVILRRHVLGNITNTLLVQAAVLIPTAILGEAVLSYLGLGPQPPTPSWGILLTNAQDFLETNAWLAVLPGLAILVAALAFNLLGDGLRDVLDPKEL